MWSTSPVIHGVTITVKDKEYADDRYLIWDTIGNVYELEDSILDGRFNVSTLYAEFTPGETYTVTLRGARVPMFSLYPNIIEHELHASETK